MKNRIAKKLFVYFTLTLIIFTIIISGIFIYLSKDQTEKYYKDYMMSRANYIANYVEKTSFSSVNLTYSIDDLLLIINSSPEKIWIVDKYNSIIIFGEKNKKHPNKDIYGGLTNRKNTGRLSDLSKKSLNIIDDVLQGETKYSEDFSNELGEKSLTLGVPIVDEYSNVVGAVMLHLPITTMNLNTETSIKILLWSFLIALILSFPTAYLFSIKFTKPLKNMEKNALLLAEGNYNIKNNISQNDEVGDLANTLDILSNKLYIASLETEKLNKLRQDFIANISHELRTPVTVIRGAIEGFVDNIFTDKETKEIQYKQMLKETMYLQRLINDLLELSRVQNTDFEISKENISINQLCEDSLRTISHIADKQSITINSSFDFDDTPFYGDYLRLKQTLIIILDNAIKFSNEKGVIDFFYRIDKDKKTIEISNYGSTISDENLPYIFEKFYKSKDESNKEGTGLGLAIAKQICTRHNIDLGVTSKDNKTTFYLKF